ncbi:MAG: DUF4136 domain-containing protein [Gemmatimonadetes bacterium]|nr:DUF4136 domain-containing protein [Gemmatimonadota bacterium]
MEKKWSVLPVLAGALLLFVSCYPGSPTNVAELDIVVTAHDDTVTFTSFATYALLDSVVHIDLDSLDFTEDSLLDRSNDALILARVRAGIEGLGYMEELDPANKTPDVLLLVGAMAVTKNAYFSYGWWPYYSWYPYYPCCYGPGYGWGYPVGGVGSVSYNTGTLVITMLDPSRPGTGMQAPVLWVAGINGLLEGSAASQTARITNLIDQAFDQSPYLSAN